MAVRQRNPKAATMEPEARSAKQRGFLIGKILNVECIKAQGFTSATGFDTQCYFNADM